jgi:hypothetical protein
MSVMIWYPQFHLVRNHHQHEGCSAVLDEAFAFMRKVGNKSRAQKERVGAFFGEHVAVHSGMLCNRDCRCEQCLQLTVPSCCCEHIPVMIVRNHLALFLSICIHVDSVKI